MRHSKFRNTGILFELLTRQITADIIGGRDDSAAKNILFKYFREGTELGKEYRLYNLLLREKIKDMVHADRLLDVIINARKKLNNSKLIKEKYELIKEIKELYPINDFLKSNIKNYRTLASIYKIFEDSVSKDIKFDIKEIYQAKTCIVEHMLDKQRPVLNETDDIIKFYEGQSEEIRLLSYKMLIDGVNEKYKNLNDEQKLILKEYINNISNTNNLNVFINEQIKKIKSQLNEFINKITDSDVIKIKINEVIKQLDGIKLGNVVKDNQIMILLLSYELIKEIKNQLKSKL